MTGTDATMAPLAGSAPKPELSLSEKELKQAKLLVGEQKALVKQFNVFMDELSIARRENAEESVMAMKKALVKSQHDQIEDVHAKLQSETELLSLQYNLIPTTEKTAEERLRNQWTNSYESFKLTNKEVLAPEWASMVQDVIENTESAGQEQAKLSGLLSEVKNGDLNWSDLPHMNEIAIACYNNERVWKGTGKEDYIPETSEEAATFIDLFKQFAAPDVEMDVFCQTIIDTWAREDTYPMDDWANSDIDSSLRKFQAAVAGFKGILKFERSQNTAVKDEDGNVLHFKINPWGMGGFFADKVKPGQRQIEVDELIDIVKAARIEVAQAKKGLIADGVESSVLEASIPITMQKYFKRMLTQKWADDLDATGAVTRKTSKKLGRLVHNVQRGHVRSWDRLHKFLPKINSECEDARPWAKHRAYKKFAADGVSFNDFCSEIKSAHENAQDLLELFSW